LLILIYY